MVAAGIIDPAKVVRVALQDAASVAGLLITTEAMVTDRPEPKGRAWGMTTTMAWVAWVAWAAWEASRPRPPSAAAQKPIDDKGPSRDDGPFIGDRLRAAPNRVACRLPQLAGARRVAVAVLVTPRAPSAPRRRCCTEPPRHSRSRTGDYRRVPRSACRSLATPTPRNSWRSGLVPPAISDGIPKSAALPALANNAMAADQDNNAVRITASTMQNRWEYTRPSVARELTNARRSATSVRDPDLHGL